MVEISVPIEELRKAKIMVCTPMYGGMCGGMYTKASCDLATLASKYEMDLKFFISSMNLSYQELEIICVMNLCGPKNILISCL